MMKPYTKWALTILMPLIFWGQATCQSSLSPADEALLDRLQRETFNYYWVGGEPISGAAPERFHEDIYPRDDADVVTIGGTGFAIMATVVAIERGFISRKDGRKRLDRLSRWLDQADRFHGAWPHWLEPSGRTKPFSTFDDGGDLVETAFLAEGLIVARQYFQDGNGKDRALAKRMDDLWRGIEWDWYTKGGEDVLYWHWSPKHGWKMNFAVTGYNECTVMYILATASPTHPVPAAAYHKGYMRDGDILTDATAYDIPVLVKHNGETHIPVGPLFWAHYSFTGLDPRGLQDKHVNYWDLNRNHAKVHHAYAVDNPRNYQGYSAECWGLTASYTMTGYTSHKPSNDFGVITPTAALSSMPYTPEESMAFLRHLYQDHTDIIGQFGPYDAFSEQSGWHLPRYLAIDQLPIPVMVENYRSGLIWKLFMSAPEIQDGLRKLDMTSTPTTTN